MASKWVAMLALLRHHRCAQQRAHELTTLIYLRAVSSESLFLQRLHSIHIGAQRHHRRQQQSAHAPTILIYIYTRCRVNLYFYRECIVFTYAHHKVPPRSDETDVKAQHLASMWRTCASATLHVLCIATRGGGLGSRPKKMYGERLGDGVEYHLMSPTPRR